MIESYLVRNNNPMVDGRLYLGDYFMGFRGRSVKNLIPYLAIKKIEKVDSTMLLFIKAHNIIVTFEDEDEKGVFDNLVGFSMFKRDEIYERIMVKWQKGKDATVPDYKENVQKELAEFEKI